MRPLWKGSISFGLVNIPVKLYLATQKKDISFRNLHVDCHTPIKYHKKCPRCDKQVKDEEIVKGYEYEKDSFVIISDKDLQKIPQANNRSIEILDFINLNEIDPVYFDRTYYLAPEQTGEKAYALLQQVMEATDKIGLANLVIRSKQSLAAVRVYDGYLALETMYYPDEVRNTAELPSWNRDITPHENEIKMARELIGNLTARFNPEKYRDEYREELIKIIEAKITGEEVTTVETPEKGEVVDLVEALKASVEATRQEEQNSSSEEKEKESGKKGKKKGKTKIGSA